MIVAFCAPDFALAVARSAAAAPPSAGAPLLLADGLERGRVLAVSATAARLGARPGMTLLQAHACAPGAQALLHAPGRVQAAWETYLDAFDAASPLIEDAGPGRAFLDMRGSDGSAERWLETVAALAAEAGAAAGQLELDARLGLASNRFTAWAAAYAGDRTVCPQGAEATLLAPLPLSLLEIEPQTAERLALLGITTLGELVALPHGPFVRRFGAAAARWHALAGGLDEAPLVPRPRAVRIEHTRYGEGSAEREEQLLFALRGLVERVADDVALTGKRATGLVLTLECEDAESFTLTAAIAQPTARAATMFDLLRARLEGCVLHAPVCGLRLRAKGLEAGAAPLSLFASGDPDPDAVALALARLEAAFGVVPQRLRLEEGYRFSARAAGEPFEPAFRATPPPADGPPAHARFLPNRLRAPTPDAAHATLQFRPHPPRPVDVTLRASLPAVVGTPPQAVVACAGPWRTDERWWTAPRTSNDYDVLLEDGALLRIGCTNGAWFSLGVYD